MLNNLCICLNSRHQGDIEKGDVKRICPDKYHEYAKKVKEKHRELGLNYYPQCPTVHKGIEHAADSMRAIYSVSRVLTLADLTENPLESKNKQSKMIDCTILVRTIEFNENEVYF